MFARLRTVSFYLSTSGLQKGSALSPLTHVKLSVGRPRKTHHPTSPQERPRFVRENTSKPKAAQWKKLNRMGRSVHLECFD
jgi:hypothetical protein